MGSRRDRRIYRGVRNVHIRDVPDLKSKQEQVAPRFIDDVSQKNWGNLVPIRQPTKLADGDLEFLGRIRAVFERRFVGLPIPFRVLDSWGERHGIPVGVRLSRLWRAGYIDKYAMAYHTISGRPQYASYYIWNDREPLQVDSNTPQFFETHRVHLNLEKE